MAKKKEQHELTPTDEKVLQSICTEIVTIIETATLREKELLIATRKVKGTKGYYKNQSSTFRVSKRTSSHVSPHNRKE